jgi:hypothetical protein
VRLFVSHAHADVYLARALQVRLEELSPELDVFVLADDVFGGDLWEDRIREAARTCDGIVSLVTRKLHLPPVVCR